MQHQNVDDHDTVAFLAILQERFDVIIGVLQSTPDLGRKTNRTNLLNNGGNFLNYASNRGSLPAITALVTAGSSVYAMGRYNAKNPQRDDPADDMTDKMSFGYKNRFANESDHDTAIFAAIRHNRLSAFHLLIKLEADVEQTVPFHNQQERHTALTFAIYIGNEDIVRLLLDCGSNSNPQISPTLSDSLNVVKRYSVPQPLNLALKSPDQKRAALTSLLIEKGANVNYGWFISKPLIIAIEQRFKAGVGQLLAAGADVKVHPSEPERGSTDRLSPLHYAVGSDARINLEIVDLLLQEGADANYCDAGSDQPLILAIAARNPKIAASLLRSGANPNPLGPRQTSPLLSATYFNEPAMVTMLIESGADINRKGHSGIYEYDVCRYTPLAFAKQLGRKRIRRILATPL